MKSQIETVQQIYIDNSVYIYIYIYIYIYCIYIYIIYILYIYIYIYNTYTSNTHPENQKLHKGEKSVTFSKVVHNQN